MRFLIRTILTGLFGWTVWVSTTRAVADNWSAFPAAAPKMVRHVLELPEYSHEEDMKVELIVGQSEWVMLPKIRFYSFEL